MRVIVEEALFRGDRGDEHHAGLHALFGLGLARHTIEIDPARSTLFTHWLSRQSEQTRRLCKHVLDGGVKRQARPRRRTVRVADVDGPAWDGTPRLPLAQAIHVLHRPLWILLENGRNDRNFLEIVTRLASNFDLRKLVSDRVIEIRACGGVDENREWIGTLGRDDHHGLWVMCDSDALCAWAPPKDGSTLAGLGEGAKRLHDACVNIRVRIHILRRRSIDNYLPLQLLEQWSFQHQAKRQGIYKAFAGLSPEQRHHYNMKDGFSKERDRRYGAEPENIFEKLSPELRADLENGFNNRNFSIADLFDEGYLLKEFRIPISPRWLRQDGQEDEAQRIAQSILELL
jgi:hypothetical protein